MDSDSYPYLYDVATERSHLFSERSEMRVGFTQSVGISLDGDEQGPSLFRVVQETGQWYLCPTETGVSLSLNQKLVVEKTPLSHLAIIQADRHVLVFVEHEDAKTTSSYAANLWLLSQMLDPPPSLKGESPSKQTIHVGETVRVPFDQIRQMSEEVVPLEIPGTIPLPENRAIIGRDTERADICLPDVRVSRLHAAIERTGPYATITDLKSANRTFVNGEPITKPTVITDGTRVQIGPHTWVYRGHALYPLCRENNVELVARNLVRRVPDRRIWTIPGDRGLVGLALRRHLEAEC